jgi:adenylosuccinate synthase
MLNASSLWRFPLDYVIAISGPVAVGKSTLANQFIERFRTYRISTRQLLLDKGVKDERGALVDAGNNLDRETDGVWVRDGVLAHLDAASGKQIVLIDAVRTARQVYQLRERFKGCFIHLHVTAPLEVVKARYISRAAASDQSKRYEDVHLELTEGSVSLLSQVADRVIMNDRCCPKSLLARATAGLGLFPLAVEPLVDVFVGGQYGSEGNPCECVQGLVLAKSHEYCQSPCLIGL